MEGFINLTVLFKVIVCMLCFIICIYAYSYVGFKSSI